MTKTFPYYDIWFLGSPISETTYPTREAAQAVIDSIPESKTIACVGEDYEIEEWTEQNTFDVEEDWVRCHTPEQFAKYTRLADFQTPGYFADATGYTFDALKGEWFQVHRDRVHLRRKQDG